MSHIINQYSFVIFAAIFLLVVAYLVISRTKLRWQDVLPLGLLAASLVAAWVVLRPIETPHITDTKKVQALIGQGQPVLLEFQSPY
jgi:hypothetical protein